MKNKTFEAVPITQEIIDKIEDSKYYHTIYDGEPDFDLGIDIKNSVYSVSAEILIEQPLPIGKTAEEFYKKFFHMDEQGELTNSDIEIIQCMEGFSSQLQPSQVDKKQLADCWRAAQDAMEKNNGNKTMSQPFQTFVDSLTQPSQVGGTEREVKGNGIYCRSCNGAGYYSLPSVRDKLPCPTCKGTGGVKVGFSTPPLSVLPSDEEIKREAYNTMPDFYKFRNDYEKERFIQGAKWMRDKWLASHKGGKNG